MAIIRQAEITGDQGENMAQLLLSQIARVNLYRKDYGLDFYCELRDNPSRHFFIQAKGSSNPKYTANTINSLPVNAKTVEQYWLTKTSPVFVFMSDTKQKRTYYTIVDENTYRPRKSNQKTYVFSIPLANEITSENIGFFVRRIIENTFDITKEERECFLDDHYRKNPELYLYMDEIDRFLEIMRGSDQTAQVEIKMLLRQRYEEGTIISHRLREGLISIFINSKDHITQFHTLDTLIYINETAIISQIIKQIDRNIRLYEYLLGYGNRSYLTDFLFQALVRFKAKNTEKDLIRFLNSKDPNLLRGAARTCGELGLNEAVPHLLTLLSHNEDYVRHEASRALRFLIDNNTVSKLTSMLANPSTPLQLEGAIRAIAETEDWQHANIVASFASDSNSAVRVAVAFCLGKTDPIAHIRLLMRMMTDDDWKVRDEAKRSVHKCIQVPGVEGEIHPQATGKTIPAVEVEQIALLMLKEAYASGKIPQAETLLHFCKGELSIPTLLDIYHDKKSHPTRFEYHDQMGKLEASQDIDIKINVLEILKQYNIPDLRDDVIRQIESSDPNMNIKYIIIAGEMKLKEVFNPLCSLFLKKNQSSRQWITSALISIDPDRTRALARSVLKTKPSLDISISCFQILHSVGLDKDDEVLVNSQVSHLSRRQNVRRDERFQLWVKVFNVMGVIPQFMKDLWAGKIEFSTNILEMIKNPKGRDLVISKLQAGEVFSKYSLIQWLGGIGDPISIAAVSHYVDDTDPDISRLASRIVSVVVK